MKRLLFQDRDGQTPLPPEYYKDLIPKSIQTIGELDEHEEQNIALGLSWLEQQNTNVADHLFWRHLHKELFANVWKWAGKVRKIELQNVEFLRVYQIESALKQLEEDLQFWLSENKIDAKEISARFHERMLTIHPFPNGNGRFTRILTAYICERHGYPTPIWGEMYTDPKTRRQAYIDALVRARNELKYNELIKFMFG